MTYYQECLKTEQEGNTIISDYLESIGATLTPITDVACQKIVGDFIAIMPKLGFQSVEVKTEKRFTGNLFVEEYSNRKVGTHGWLFKSEAMLLICYWLDEDTAVSLSLPDLKRWLLEENAIDKYPSITVKAAQMNTAVGRIIPIADLKHIQHFHQFQPRKHTCSAK